MVEIFKETIKEYRNDKERRAEEFNDFSKLINEELYVAVKKALEKQKVLDNQKLNAH